MNGKDGQSGTAAAPVASLQRAQALARKAGQATVVVHEGTWFLSEPLVLTAEDSGCTWRAAEGETAILSGGRPGMRPAEKLRKALDQIERRRELLDAGDDRFGRCDVCGADLGEDALGEMAWADRCRDHYAQ